MKKTRILAMLLVVAIVTSVMSSCNISDIMGGIIGGSDGDNLNLSSGYTIAYSRASDSDVRMEEMIKKGYAAFGGKVDSNSNKLKSFDKEIILGGVDSKEETKELVKSFKANTNDMLGAYVVRAIGKKVLVYASCPEAEQLAVDALFSYVEDGKLILPKDLDLTVYFNLYEYKNSGELRILSDGVFGIAEPASVKIDGMTVEIKPGVYEYLMSASPTDAFPTEDEIEVLLYSDEMSYEISYSESSVVITINSKDGAKSQEYKFTYGFDDEYTVSTVIVNKNGAKGALSLIFDDGETSTATFFYEKVAPKYSAFKISIALYTSQVAALKKSADGKSWLMDEDGKYILDVGEARVSFWQNILTCDQIELISHTHTCRLRN